MRYEDKEVKTFLKILKKELNRPKSKKEAHKFLVSIGVITEKGNLKKRYKNLRLP